MTRTASAAAGRHRTAIAAAAVALASLAADCGGASGTNGVAHASSTTTTTTGQSSSADPIAFLIKFAGCMPTHEVPDFPDPDNQSEFRSTSRFDRSSPIFQTAQKPCSPLAGGFVKRRQ